MKYIASFQLAVKLGLGCCLLPTSFSKAETFLSRDQAQQAIWKDTKFKLVDIQLTKEQIKLIKSRVKTKVNSNFKAYKSIDGSWFIVDQVVGKHEYIDMAVGITSTGVIKDVEILTYRETYGGQIRNVNWLKQFFGRNHKEILKLDKQIKNISGATLSCKHVTQGVNKLNQIWYEVLRHH